MVFCLMGRDVPACRQAGAGRLYNGTNCLKNGTRWDFCVLDIKLASYGGSQSEILKSLQFLKDIHAQGGTVSNEALADIAKKNKYDRYGSFYKGKKASLVKVQSDGKEMVALTRNGMDRLVAAGLIEE